VASQIEALSKVIAAQSWIIPQLTEIHSKQPKETVVAASLV
jgi:hypothetical protein